MDVVCSGPGPHVPPDGVLGAADRLVDGMVCASDACSSVVEAVPVDAQQPAAVDPEIVQSVTDAVSKATTIAALKAALAPLLADLKD